MTSFGYQGAHCRHCQASHFGSVKTTDSWIIEHWKHHDILDSMKFMAWFLLLAEMECRFWYEADTRSEVAGDYVRNGKLKVQYD